MQIFSLFLLFLLFLRSLCSPIECGTSLITFATNPDYAMLYNSGKSLNDLGFYDECNNDPRTKYVLVTGSLASLSAFKAKLGFCGPKECSIENYEQVSYLIKPFLTKGFNLTDSSSVSFSLYFPSVVNDKSLSNGCIVMISITCFIVFICLIGTLVDINENHFNFRNVFMKKEPNATCISEIEELNNEQLIQKPLKTSKLAIFFMCFSYMSNLNKLVSSIPGANPRLEILNGIRVISILWVIFGHTYYYILSSPVMNPTKIIDIVQNFWYSFLFQAPFSVDAFFFLAGFLSAYIMIGEIKKRNGKLNFFMLFFHRYYRIMPLYSFLIFMAWYFVPYLKQGPMWPDYEMTTNDGCSKHWWTNIIFLNNFISWESPCDCFGWGWYLANDYQFFAMTPFLLLFYYKSKIYGWIAVLTLLIASYITTLVLAIEHDYAVGMIDLAANYLDYWNVIYCKPYCRVAPYLIGIVLAYLFLEQGDKNANNNDFAVKLKRLVGHWYYRYILYFLSFWFIALPVFLPIDANKNPGKWGTAANAIYITFSRTIFTLGISFFAYPCLLGHGTPIYKFLACSFWTPFARLTFAAYLVHPIIIQMNYYGTKQGFYFDDMKIFFNYCSHIILTFIFALILSLSIESPMLNIEKNFIFKRKKIGQKDEKKAIEKPEIENKSVVKPEILFNKTENYEKERKKSIN